MVPLLVPEVFPPVDFSMQAHVFFGDAWHHPYISILVFVENVFTSLVYIIQPQYILFIFITSILCTHYTNKE